MVQNTKIIFYKSCFLDLERIKIIYINSNGKNCFDFRINRFLNSLPERIMFENRGLTVHQNSTAKKLVSSFQIYFLACKYCKCSNAAGLRTRI